MTAQLIQRKTNLMHSLSSVYFVKNLYMFRAYLSLSSGATLYGYNNWYLLFSLDDSLLPWPSNHLCHPEWLLSHPVSYGMDLAAPFRDKRWPDRKPIHSFVTTHIYSEHALYKPLSRVSTLDHP
jgi:hypothetical protein